MFSISQKTSAQGFINLDFEQVRFTSLTTNSSGVFGAATCPGWPACFAGFSTTNFGYNALSLGAAAAGLFGTNGGFSLIHGKYFMLLQGSYGYGGPASIGQTGTIPANAQSLVCWGYVGAVTFNSQPLSFISLGSTNGYGIYGADVSGFAGQTGQLLFTAVKGITFNHPSTAYYYPGEWAYLDNSQFAAAPVPEPFELCGSVPMVLSPANPARLHNRYSLVCRSFRELL